MEIKAQRNFDVITQQLINSLPESLYPSPITSASKPRATTTPPQTKTPPQRATFENALTKPIFRDNVTELISQAQNLAILDRHLISRLLHLCCEFDSVNSARALINGEICNNGDAVVPLINEIDGCSGFTPLHTAAENHSLKCIELLIRKRARTDLKTKPVNGETQQQQLLALELALKCYRMEVHWGPDEALDDLLLMLSEKDLSAVRVLAEKTKEVGEVAYTLAMEGRVALLAALLMVAADRVNWSVLELRTDADYAAERTTVYNCVIREAISVFSRIKKDNGGGGEEENKRRKLLLREMELLHFFGGSPSTSCGDKKWTSPLILASQAGDEIVLKLLLKTDLDVNEADSEGNSALHWSVKACKVANPEQIRILCLLLKHGARVKQRNMLGLTAVHIAAGNGNLEALEILLLHDPDSVYVTSEFKETPLFSAVKNDFIECAQLLLRFGAATDVHNLRRERPIDVAKSQDMRSALSPTSIIITNRASKQKYTACVHSDEVISETCEMLLKDSYPTSESASSSSDNEVCKYYRSPTGCVRGSKCFYKHEEEPSISKSRMSFIRSAALVDFKRKIFVGGLPPTLDSESLRRVIEEQFGPVVEAKVLEIETDGQVVSRCFGFVNFKHEKSVASAVEAHYIDVWGKRVELKSAVPKSLLSLENHLDEPRPETVQQESVQQVGNQLHCQTLSHEQSTGEGTPEEMSWAERVAQGQPTQPVKVLKARRSGQVIPVWLDTFKKWLPQFLRKMSKNSREGEFYSLSSVKSDFKAVFGKELDHRSLGYSKLSDFIKSFPGLCRIKNIHTGGHTANHMILLPSLSRPPPLVIPKKDVSVPRPVTPVSDDDLESHKFHEDPLRSYCENTALTNKKSEEDTQSDRSSEINIETTAVNNAYKMGLGTCSTFAFRVPLDHSRFLQFLEPDPLFLGRRWLGTGGFKTLDEHCRPKHLVLEALARKRKEIFFLRPPKFYHDYEASLKKGNCFACGKNKMLWANFPCRHALWCDDCKFIAMKVAVPGTSTHKCVVCDRVVEKIEWINWAPWQQHIHNDSDFPPIHTAYLK